MDLDILSIITGKKSISDMSDTELIEHLQAVRSARFRPQQSSTATPKKSSSTSAMEKMIKSMSKEQIAMILAQLEGDSNDS